MRLIACAVHRDDDPRLGGTKMSLELAPPTAGTVKEWTRIS